MSQHKSYGFGFLCVAHLLVEVSQWTCIAAQNMKDQGLWQCVCICSHSLIDCMPSSRKVELVLGIFQHRRQRRIFLHTQRFAHPIISQETKWMCQVTGDADIHVAVGVLHSLARNYDAAGNAFRAALQLRTQDYSLW